MILARQAYYSIASQVVSHVTELAHVIDNGCRFEDTFDTWDYLTHQLSIVFAELLDIHLSENGTLHRQDLQHYQRLIHWVNEIDSGTRLYLKLVAAN